MLCPGWVRTNILEADRNWPAEFGAKPDDDPANAVTRQYSSGRWPRVARRPRWPTPSLDAVAADRFWVIPHQDFLDICIERWATIAERADPQPPEEVPGMPPRSQILAEVAAALGLDVPAAPTSP